MENESIHAKHRKRLRERYIKEGIDNFEAHQILELMLFYAIPRKDTNELAHRLLNRFGSLTAVFEAPVKELMQVEGIGNGAAIFLNMISQIKRKYDLDKLNEKVYLNSTSDAGEYAVKLFCGRLYECFYVINLNSQNKVINAQKICEGTINEVVVYPASVVKSALQNNATKVIIAHNHPGGKLSPSLDDLNVTRVLKDALAVVDIKLAEHIIVADDKYTVIDI